MTFFYDELPREPKILTRRQKWVRRILFGILFFFAMVWIALRALMSMGGSNPQLTHGLEEYLRGVTGFDTHVGRLGGVTFYPFIGVDMSDVSFSPPGVQGWPVATIGRLVMRASFWDLFFHRGTVSLFGVRDIDFGSSLDLAQTVKVEHFVLAKADKPGAATLTLDGFFGPDRFKGVVAMGWRPDGMARPVFFLPARSVVTFTSPEISIAGTLSRRDSGGLEIDDAKITMPGVTLSGLLAFATTSHGVEWQVDVTGGHTNVAFDLENSPQTLSGKINIKHLDLQDGKLIATTINDLLAILPGDTLRDALKRRSGKIDIRIDALSDGPSSFGSISAPVTFDHGQFTAAQLAGTVAGGKLTGRASFDGRGDAPSFDSKGHVSDWRLGKAPGQLRGDAFFALHAAALSVTGLPGALTGEIVATAKTGTLGAAMSGVVLPAAPVSCLLAEIPVANGAASLSPLLAQAGTFRFAADGHVTRTGIDAAAATQDGNTTAQGFILRGNWDHLTLTPSPTTDPHAATALKQPPADMFKSFPRGDLGIANGPCATLLSGAAK